MFKRIPELEKVDLDLCINCKGAKLACGLSRCPLMSAFDITPSSKEKIEALSFDNNIFGPTPQVFIGNKGYPNVFSGPMTSLNPDSELAKFAGLPSLWTSLSMNEIVELRFGLLRGMKKSPVQMRDAKSIDDRVISGIQEIAKSENPVEVESQYTGKINPTLRFDAMSAPLGPSASMKSLDVTGHARIPRIVERTLDDELKSAEQLSILSSAGFDVYYLQNLVSAGTTGREEQAKLVPTRWSITMTDDTVGKQLIQNLRDFKTIEKITVLHGGFFGNYFTILLLPDRWIFENFEAWATGSIFTLAQEANKFNISADHEGLLPHEYYKGKSKYSSQAGGYYAARLGILQYLNKIKRQAKVISFREITSEYIVPSGVWVVREAARLATECVPKHFETYTEAVTNIDSILIGDFVDFKRKSVLLSQQSLDAFF